MERRQMLQGRVVGFGSIRVVIRVGLLSTPVRNDRRFSGCICADAKIANKSGAR